MYSILYSVLHCMYCTWYDTCTHALTLRGQPHSWSVPPVSGAQLAGGSAGRAAGAPLPLPGPPRRSPGTGRRWGDEEKLLLPPEGCLLGHCPLPLPCASRRVEDSAVPLPKAHGEMLMELLLAGRWGRGCTKTEVSSVLFGFLNPSISHTKKD